VVFTAYTVKKRFTSFPSPAGMSLTKLPLGKNNSVITSLFPPRESLVVTSRLGTGNSRTFFYGVKSLWEGDFGVKIKIFVLIFRGLFGAAKFLLHMISLILRRIVF
jgi:hypothetical protein